MVGICIGSKKACDIIFPKRDFRVNIKIYDLVTQLFDVLIRNLNYNKM